jgi:hypothetical protein
LPLVPFLVLGQSRAVLVEQNANAALHQAGAVMNELRNFSERLLRMAEQPEIQALVHNPGLYTPSPELARFATPDIDNLLVLLGTAGVNFIMGVPGADDIMLNYQSTSFHDQLFVRQVLGLQRAPEFAAWLENMGLTDGDGRLLPANPDHRLLADLRRRLP